MPQLQGWGFCRIDLFMGGPLIFGCECAMSVQRPFIYLNAQSD
jgi:hypothetical protein